MRSPLGHGHNLRTRAAATRRDTPHTSTQKPNTLQTNKPYTSKQKYSELEHQRTINEQNKEPAETNPRTQRTQRAPLRIHHAKHHKPPTKRKPVPEPRTIKNISKNTFCYALTCNKQTKKSINIQIPTHQHITATHENNYLSKTERTK